MSGYYSVTSIIARAQEKQIAEGLKPSLPIDVNRKLKSDKQFMPHARRKGEAWQRQRRYEMERIARA